MKQSFKSLAARSSLPWTLLIVLVLTVIEVGLFRLLGWSADRLETAFTGTRIYLVFVIALAGLHADFCLRGLLGAKSDLPYARLGLGRRQLLRMLAEQNAVCYFILWAWQALLALGLAAWWCHAHPAAVGPQTVFVTVYRDSFLHALLPLGLPLARRVLGLCRADAQDRGADDRGRRRGDLLAGFHGDENLCDH